MTTVVGLQGSNWAVVGADTRVVEDGRIFNMPTNAGKIVRKDGYIIGVAGDFRPAQIFAHHYKFPKLPTYTTIDALDKFFTQKFIPIMRETFKEHDFTPSEEDGVELIVSIQGTIYNISDDYAWARDKRGVYAIGSGSGYAIGALAAIGQPKSASEGLAAAKAALSIAVNYDNNSGEPFSIYQQVRNG
jgi:ATP-dependent protease HslVU (ClpYQ) peptidase subunit